MNDVKVEFQSAVPSDIVASIKELIDRLGVLDEPQRAEIAVRIMRSYVEGYRDALANVIKARGGKTDADGTLCKTAISK